jgi:class 3 adenylate cyclase
MTTEQRRLAAILVADVVGYSKLMGSDEAGTLTQLEALRTKIIGPQIAKHAGRLFKSVGDGFLVEFASAVQAVSCAKAIQEANALMPLRIGIQWQVCLERRRHVDNVQSLLCATALRNQLIACPSRSTIRARKKRGDKT